MLPESQLREFYGYQINDARRLGQLRWDEEGQVRNDDGDDAWSDISSTPTAPIICIHREPYFRVWLDLSIATDPADPESLQKELSELRRIQREWYHREKREVATKRVTRVQEWRRGLKSHDQSNT
ncbi:hypothetical protein EXIGLDRAFT_766654 [Exidia glandulosa HHB12029]|uniref:Uncharacterized protein n=1 Tax=Exidia glandulosa HHB12029 TaxID=1314781 RepID=A0A165JJ32_EXIGL|nr:hypothetical protein EXIGLDRAFT_766654 [Exidia glandulosa HHB12029]